MRSRMSVRFVGTILLLGITPMLTFGAAPPPREWGTVKGQVIWTEKATPANLPIRIPPPGLAGNPILANKLVIDAKSRGVRWVLVWLADPKDATNVKFVPPIHLSLVGPQHAMIQTSRREFHPRVQALWGKEVLLIENNDDVLHTVQMIPIGPGPNVNLALAPKETGLVKGFVPKLLPTAYSSRAFPWMKGYLGTFAHPYFAVTDADGKFEIQNAPVGKFQLLLWHEESGFLTQPNLKNKKVRGKLIEITRKGVTDVGKIGMKVVDD